MPAIYTFSVGARRHREVLGVIILAPTACPCCGSIRLWKLGESIAETAEFIAVRWTIIESVREKIARQDCEWISQPPPPPFHSTPRSWAKINFFSTWHLLTAIARPSVVQIWLGHEHLFGPHARTNLEMLGSMPSRTPNMLSISRSFPFRQLQGGIGRATYRLNTIVVGLELVANGGDKNPGLPIRWEKPKTEAAARQVANQAREFALTAALVYGADIADAFLRGIARETWLKFPKSVVFIAAKEGAGPGGKAFSVRDRAEALCLDLSVECKPLLGMLDLLAKWRNKLAHSANADERRLDKKSREELFSSAAELAKNYANIDIKRTLKSFDDGDHPSRKDATVLLACCQNLARAIDEAAIRRVTPDSDSVADLAVDLLRARWTSSGDGRKGWVEFCDIWDRCCEDRNKLLIKVLQQVGVTENSSPISPLLPPSFLSTLANMDRQSAMTYLKMTDS